MHRSRLKYVYTFNKNGIIKIFKILRICFLLQLFIHSVSISTIFGVCHYKDPLLTPVRMVP